MKNKKKIILSLLISGTLLNSLAVVANNYSYRYPASGVDSKEGGLSGGSGDEVLPEERDSSPWEDFAIANSLTYGDWNSLDWGQKGLTSLPDEPYPLANPSGDILLYENNLSSLHGLSTINSVNTIAFGGNSFTNLDDLSNLESANTINSVGNPLTNINGLSNISSLNNLYLNNANISDISAIYDISGLMEVGVSNNSSLNAVQFANVDLSNVEGLFINGTNTSDISFLSNAPKLKHFYANETNITNVNSLSHLTNMGFIYLQDNPSLVDVSGLRNLTSAEVANVVIDSAIDSRSGFVPIPATSWICTTGKKSLTGENGHPFAKVTDVCR